MDLHELYKEELKKAWADQKMVDFCAKKAEVVVQTKDGWLLEVERQYIKKNFCFGYGHYGVATDEEMDTAFDNANNARKDVSRFIEENTEYYDRYIKALEENDAYVSLNGHYYSQTKDCLLQNFVIQNTWHHDYSKDENYKLLDSEEKASLIEAFKEGKEKMLKRLNTYLKKFGLSKLNVWTYLRD